MVTKLESSSYHCSGCDRIMDCPLAFKYGSENCDSYVRSSFHNCHKCLRFGQACQQSGLIKCDFLPRVTEDPFERLNGMRMEMESER